MQLYYLSYITTIIERKNLTKAADDLHMTQTALSKAVARLETELGYPLFERSGRNIVPNTYGLKFYEWAKKTLTGYDHLMNEFELICKSDFNTLTIAFDGMYSSRTLLTQVRQQYPELNINEIYYNSYDEFPDVIYKSHIDCVLSFVQYEDSEYVNRIKLLDDPLMLVLPSSSVHAGRDALGIEDIKDLSFIFPSENNKIHNQVNEAFSASGFKLQTGSRMFREHLIYELSQGLACGFLSHHTLSALGNTGKFVVKPMSDPGFERSIYLYWHNRSNTSPALNIFKESLKNNVSVLM